MTQGNYTLPTGNPLIECSDGQITAKDAALEMTDAVSRSQFYIWRRAKNANIRFNWWPGQSDDGRRHRDDLGSEPFPWENAPDNRILLSDQFIQEDVRKIKGAFLKGDFPQPEGVKDAEWATQCQMISHNMVRSRMMPEVLNEVEQFANWRQSYGNAAISVDWVEQLALEERTVTLQDLQEEISNQAKQAQISGGEEQAASGAANIMSAFMDESREDEAIQFFLQWQPGVKKSSARSAVRDLRADGTAEFVAPYVTAGKAKWEALEIMADLVLPANTRDPQQARWIARRHLFSPSELRAKAKVEDWNEEWVNKAIEQMGITIFNDWQTWVARNPEGVLGMEAPYQLADRLVEVWVIYTKRTGKDGQTGVYYNAVHPTVTEFQGWDKDKLLGYEHGMYPFVFGQREKFSKVFLESRGMPEILFTQQNGIKIQRDMREARAEMDTLPPVNARLQQGKARLRFGPAAVNFSRDGKGYEFMQMPPQPETSVEVEHASRLEAERYFGRMISDGIPPEVAAEYNQDLVDQTMSELGQAVYMTFQLQCQYQPAEDVELVAGKLLHEWPVDAQEIRTPHFFTPQFDIRRLNHEYVTSMVDTLGKLMPLDAAGVIDRAGIMGMIMRLIDPGFSKFVKSTDEVTQKEINDQNNRIAQIAVGIQPPLPESGVNPQLRLQTIATALKGSQRLQTIFANPDSIETQVLQKEAEHYQFMIQQENNAIVGRLGVQPAPMQPQAMGAA